MIGIDGVNHSSVAMSRLTLVLVVALVCSITTLANAKRQIYAIDTSWICKAYGDGEAPYPYTDGHQTQLLLGELVSFFNLLKPGTQLDLSDSYEDCNHCSGRRMCTLALCPAKWWTELSIDVNHRPTLIRYQHFTCPTTLYFAWTDTEMRARWRCHLDGTAEGDDDTCDTPPLMATESKQ